MDSISSGLFRLHFDTWVTYNANVSISRVNLKHMLFLHLLNVSSLKKRQRVDQV